MGQLAGPVGGARLQRLGAVDPFRDGEERRQQRLPVYAAENGGRVRLRAGQLPQKGLLLKCLRHLRA